MKKHIKVYNFLLAAALLTITAENSFASDPEVEKKKSYSKSYTLDGNEKVSINNQFGEVKLSTWSKNEVKVDVVITCIAGTEESAQALLNRISIEDGKNADGVYFKTKMTNDNWSNERKGKNSSSMEINYEVQLPSGNPLDLKNAFGKTIVPDYSGPVTISSKFGELTAGNISNLKKLDVEYGTATVDAVNNGEVTIKFSQALIKKLNGAIKASQSYSGVKYAVDNSLKDLSVKSEFTDLIIDVSKDIAANFDVYTNFSELRNKTELSIKEEDERGDMKFDHQYYGKSGNASIPIKVKSNFGDVTIGHNTPFDPNDEKPEKAERRERREPREPKEPKRPVQPKQRTTVI